MIATNPPAFAWRMSQPASRSFRDQSTEVTSAFLHWMPPGRTICPSNGSPFTGFLMCEPFEGQIDRERAVVSRELPCDLRTLRRVDLRPRPREDLPHGAAMLPRPDRLESLPLLRRRARIDVESPSPVPLVDRLRPPQTLRELQDVELDVPERALRHAVAVESLALALAPPPPYTSHP